MSFRNPTPFLKHATSDIVARQALKGVLKAEADIGPRIVFKSASGTVVAELKKENAQMSWERLELKAKRLVEQHFAEREVGED